MPANKSSFIAILNENWHTKPDLAPVSPAHLTEPEDCLDLSQRAANAMPQSRSAPPQTARATLQTDQQGNRLRISGNAISLAAASAVNVAWETRLNAAPEPEQPKEMPPACLPEA